MAKIESFQDLIVWQKAHQVVLFVYKISEKYPRHEIFGITSQTRRAGVSVASNIAEGFKRKSKADSGHFYNMAETSLEELKYDLILAKDLQYISEQEFIKGMDMCNEVGKLLNGWKKSQS